MEKVLEMRGMQRKEIIDYFNGVEGQNPTEGCYFGADWEVRIGDENKVSIGSLEIPSTVISFLGDEKSVEALISAFRIKFLKAGG